MMYLYFFFILILVCFMLTLEEKSVEGRFYSVVAAAYILVLMFATWRMIS